MMVNEGAWRIDPPARIAISKKPAKFLFCVIMVEEKTGIASIKD